MPTLGYESSPLYFIRCLLNLVNDCLSCASTLQKTVLLSMVNLIQKIEAFTCYFVYVFSMRNLEYTGSLTERSSVGRLRLSSTEALHSRSKKSSVKL
jgi:hypothetical protein